MKKILSLVLAIGILLPGSAFAKPARTFSDLDNPQVFAKTEINWLLNEGIITGYENGNFMPLKEMTREEFMTVMVKLLNLSSEDVEADKKYCRDQFNDVAPWAQQYVGLLAKKGLAKGIGKKQFGANKPLTREQMVVFIIRGFNMEERAIAVQNRITTDFNDINKVSAYARPAVRFAKAMKLINGVGGNNFLPNKPAQRQEVAKFLYDILNMDSRGEITKNLIGIELSNVTNIVQNDNSYTVTFNNANLQQTNPFTFLNTEVQQGTYLVFEDYQNCLGATATDWNSLSASEKENVVTVYLTTWALNQSLIPLNPDNTDQHVTLLLNGITTWFTDFPQAVMTENDLISIADKVGVTTRPD